MNCSSRGDDVDRGPGGVGVGRSCISSGKNSVTGVAVAGPDGEEQPVLMARKTSSEKRMLAVFISLILQAKGRADRQ